MGQDKKQLAKLLDYVKDLYSNPGNKEFTVGIQSIVLNDMRSEPSRDTWSKQISEIYELCLKKNLREQAEDLYKDFPIKEIAPKLVKYYIEMENARRGNNFDSFGRFLFLQIELIVDTIINDEEFRKIYDGVRDLKPLVRYKDGKPYREYRFEGKETIHKSLILKAENTDKPIDKLPTLDRCRIVMYTVCYKASVNIWPKTEFDILSGIYNIRNHDSHTGGTTSERQKENYDRLIVDKTKNYLQFLSFLLSFINGVSNNYPYPEELYILADIKKSE